MATKRKAGRELRRSARVPHHLPLLISGADRGVPFVADAETIMVNRHGAAVRTSYPLRPGMRLRMNVRNLHHTGRARVVCLLATSEFGLELENPGSQADAEANSSFWGVPIPPAEPHPLPPQKDKDKERAAEALVSGISAICIPFQEHTTVMPLSSTTAITMVRPLVQPGERLRLLIGDDSTPIQAKVTGVSRDRVSGRWRLWIEFV